MRIGTATLAIIVLPICMNSAGEKSSSERVSVNHVPQNTPVTSMISIMVMNVIEFCLTLQSNGCDRHAASLARPVNKQLPAKMQNLPVNCLYRGINLHPIDYKDPADNGIGVSGNLPGPFPTILWLRSKGSIFRRMEFVLK